ncbi:Hypothetical protein AKI40_1159 [Enterobacter sp. FY-07]|nr:Hypothetical protein AKI40_1159 [Enterobacter sp. FY-07]
MCTGTRYRLHSQHREKRQKNPVIFSKNTLHASGAFNCIYFSAHQNPARASPGAA